MASGIELKAIGMTQLEELTDTQKAIVESGTPGELLGIIYIAEQQQPPNEQVMRYAGNIASEHLSKHPNDQVRAFQYVADRAANFEPKQAN